MTTDTLAKATDTTAVVVSAGITQDAHRHSDDDVNHHNEDTNDMGKRYAGNNTPHEPEVHPRWRASYPTCLRLRYTPNLSANVL